MTISSRTPEGQPNHCPVCGADVRIEPSPLFGDATCPRCGSLLWFLNLKPRTHVIERSRSRGIRDRVIAIVAEQLGVDLEKIIEDNNFLHGLGDDSLDMAELIMDLEEEFDLKGLDLSESSADEIHPPADVSVGDHVRVISGDFQNFEGDVDAVDQLNGHVTIRVNIFGRLTPVELENWQVQRIGA